MSHLFLLGALPGVRDVRDVYTEARALSRRGIVPTLGAERLLRQVLWCMLKIQNDQMEGELHQALARLASLTLAITEDEDLKIPDDRQVGGRSELEALAVQLQLECQQRELQIGVAIGATELTVTGAPSVEAIAQRIAPDQLDEHLERTLRTTAIHLRQGLELLEKQRDPEKAAKHRARFEEACTRTTHLLARLIAIPPSRDNGSLRSHLVRRELKRIEVDALGIERISSAEQIQRAGELLAWTAVELGETVTDENRAQLAAELRRVAASDSPEPAVASGEDDGQWLFASE
jgi:hypothetical protein